MIAPILAPRPSSPVVSVAPKPQLTLTHSNSEWSAVFPEIERLYIRERRKLRYVIQYMASEHGFMATEHMYKKRFAKWGFQRYSKRSALTMRPLERKVECRRATNSNTSAPRKPGSIPVLPGLSYHDEVMLVFLSSVRAWSVAFFDSVQFCDGYPGSQQQLPPTGKQQAASVSVVFKLVVDLLDRGHGDLAGRMARKAFLLAEDMLMLEGPALAWNLLEIIYHMLMLRHMQLFHMFLAHLVALASSRMPDAHPLPTMLRGLRGLVASLTHVVPARRSSPPSSFPSFPTSSDGKMTAVDPLPLSRVLPPLLERAWTLNTELLLDRFDPRLLQLYFHIPWDSCSIAPPSSSIISAADRLLNQIEPQQMLSAATAACPTEGFPANIQTEGGMIDCPLSPRMDASPPRDFEMLRASSIAAIREHGDSVLSKGSTFNGNTTVLLPMLAGLTVVKIFEQLPVVSECLGTADCVTTKVPRLYAGNIACLIRTLINFNAEHDSTEPGASLRVVEKIRAIVALREYADGEADPRVIQEMLLLQDALVAAGENSEAQEVERDACHRMEKYIQDIPVDSV